MYTKCLNGIERPMTGDGGLQYWGKLTLQRSTFDFSRMYLKIQLNTVPPAEMTVSM